MIGLLSRKFQRHHDLKITISLSKTAKKLCQHNPPLRHHSLPATRYPTAPTYHPLNIDFEKSELINSGETNGLHLVQHKSYDFYMPLTEHSTPFTTHYRRQRNLSSLSLRISQFDLTFPCVSPLLTIIIHGGINEVKIKTVSMMAWTPIISQKLRQDGQLRQSTTKITCSRVAILGLCLKKRHSKLPTEETV